MIYMEKEVQGRKKRISNSVIIFRLWSPYILTKELIIK
jgi:hypothetical protein